MEQLSGLWSLYSSYCIEEFIWEREIRQASKQDYCWVCRAGLCWSWALWRRAAHRAANTSKWPLGSNHLWVTGLQQKARKKGSEPTRCRNVYALCTHKRLSLEASCRGMFTAPSSASSPFLMSFHPTRLAPPLFLTPVPASACPKYFNTASFLTRLLLWARKGEGVFFWEGWSYTEVSGAQVLAPNTWEVSNKQKSLQDSRTVTAWLQSPRLGPRHDACFLPTRSSSVET